MTPEQRAVIRERVVAARERAQDAPSQLLNVRERMLALVTMDEVEIALSRDEYLERIAAALEKLAVLTRGSEETR